MAPDCAKMCFLAMLSLVAKMPQQPFPLYGPFLKSLPFSLWTPQSNKLSFPPVSSRRSILFAGGTIWKTAWSMKILLLSSCGSTDEAKFRQCCIARSLGSFYFCSRHVVCCCLKVRANCAPWMSERPYVSTWYLKYLPFNFPVGLVNSMTTDFHAILALVTLSWLGPRNT